MSTEELIHSDLLLHPGKEFASFLESVGMNQESLSRRIGISRKHINRVIQGKELISANLALLLEQAFGTPASFWLNLSKNYELDVEKRRREQLFKSELRRLNRFPVREMLRYKWLKEDSEEGLAHQLLQFLGVSSFDRFDEVLSNRFIAAYRKLDKANSSKEALAVWIRAGQIEAMSKQLPKFNQDKLAEVIKQLRGSTLHIEKFEAEAKRLLMDIGIALVLVPHLKNTFVNGAAYWYGGRPVVQVSIRHKWCDVFFFTLFHELGHILLHPHNEMYIDEESLKNEREDEANHFAQRTLIPKDKYEQFIAAANYSPAKIDHFAKDIGIHPCLVVGRLQREGRVGYTHLYSALKPRFEWTARSQ